MALDKWEGRAPFAAGSAQTMTIDEADGARTATVTIITTNAAAYYWTTGSPSISSRISDQLTNNTTLQGTYTCTVDDDTDGGTGKITLSATGTSNFRVNTLSATLEAYLGWDIDTFPAAYGTSFQGSRHARYLWLPNAKRSNPLGTEPTSTSYDLGVQIEQGGMTIAPTGATKKLVYDTRRVDICEYQFLRGTKVLRGLETVVNESWEKFYTDVVYAGLRVRFHPDRSSDSVFFTWLIDSSQAGMGVQPMMPGWVGAQSLWQLQLPMLKVV